MSCPLVRLLHAHIIWSAEEHRGLGGGGGGGVLFPVLNFLGKILILCLFFLIHPFDFFSLPLAFLSLILLLLTLF